MVRKVLGVLLLAWASLGLHAGSDWKAQWINADRCQSATNTWQVYRKTVTISEVPDQLIARIAADTKYWLWVNGRLAVFEGGLKRGPSPDGTYYDPVDIAPYLVEGENTIAVLLWHFGKSGFTHVNSGLAPSLAFREKRLYSCKQWAGSLVVRGGGARYRDPLGWQLAV